MSVMNAQYCDKESTRGSLFLYRTVLKWRQSTLQFSKRLYFRKKTAKRFALSPEFQKGRFEVHKNFTNIYGIYGCVSLV